MSTRLTESKYRPKVKGRFANMHNEVKIKNTSTPFDSVSVLANARAGKAAFMSNLRGFTKEQMDAAKKAGR